MPSKNPEKFNAHNFKKWNSHCARILNIIDHKWKEVLVEHKYNPLRNSDFYTEVVDVPLELSKIRQNVQMLTLDDSDDDDEDEDEDNDTYSFINFKEAMNRIFINHKKYCVNTGLKKACEELRSLYEGKMVSTFGTEWKTLGKRSLKRRLTAEEKKTGFTLRSGRKVDRNRIQTRIHVDASDSSEEEGEPLKKKRDKSKNTSKFQKLHESMEKMKEKKKRVSILYSTPFKLRDKIKLYSVLFNY